MAVLKSDGSDRLPRAGGVKVRGDWKIRILSKRQDSQKPGNFVCIFTSTERRHTA